MKKFFMFAAMASVALVICVKNETAVSLNDNQAAIEFAAPVTSPSVKAATEIADNYPTTEQFAVWAYYAQDGVYDLYPADGGQTQEFMNMVPVGYVADAATWKPIGATYYWPKNGSLTFAAYSPYTTPSNGTYDYLATGLDIKGYVVPAASTDQKDLLFSERKYNQTVNDMDKETAVDPYKGVTLQFNHALSSIVFKVAEDVAYESKTPSTVITITSIDILQVNSMGDFNQGLTDGPAATTPAASAHFGWTNQSTPVDYNAFTGSQTLSTTPNYLASAAAADNLAERKLNTSDLILLPQTLSTETEKAVLKISYKINNQTTEVSEVSTFKLSDITAGGKWYRGKRYTYNITFHLDEITFEPKVTAWADVTETVPTI